MVSTILVAIFFCILRKLVAQFSPGEYSDLFRLSGQSYFPSTENARNTLPGMTGMRE